MKKIISLTLAILMTISMFVGCGAKTQEAPTITTEANTEPPVVHESLPEDRLFIKGIFYRTEPGTIMLLSEEHGAIILQNPKEDFAHVSDFSVVEIETMELSASEIPEAMVVECTVMKPNASSEEMAAVDSLLVEMIALGYEPSSIGTIVDGEDTYLYITPYDTITTIVDKLASDNGNVMFSPLSLNFALGMLSNGIGDDFKTKFENYFGMSVDNYNKYVQNYMQNAAPWFGETRVDIANSIWVKEPSTLQDRYVDLMDIYYDAEIQSRTFDMPFVEEVNKWCADKTQNMIPVVLDEPPLGEALLINALYFQGQWDKGYEDYQVAETDFTTATGEKVTVEGMSGIEETFYMENDNATAFAKYYKDLRYAFVGILPKEEGDFTLADLDLESLMDAGSMEFTEVYSVIPKFEFKNHNPLLNLLSDIGLPVRDMVFPNITNEQNLYVTDVFQHTAVEVNEEGTRAAAVTVIEADGAMAPGNEPQPKEVILNRPFAFMIYDMENQTPLFVGKVVNPNK